jgi:hypothetical protein
LIFIGAQCIINRPEYIIDFVVRSNLASIGKIYDTVNHQGGGIAECGDCINVHIPKEIYINQLDNLLFLASNPCNKKFINKKSRQPVEWHVGIKFEIPSILC